jgi:hypothetical protein
MSRQQANGRHHSDAMAVAAALRCATLASTASFPARE